MVHFLRHSIHIQPFWQTFPGLVVQALVAVMAALLMTMVVTAAKCVDYNYDIYSPAAASDQRRPLQSWSQHLHPLTDSKVTHVNINYFYPHNNCLSLSLVVTFCLESCGLGIEVWTPHFSPDFVINGLNVKALFGPRDFECSSSCCCISSISGSSSSSSIKVKVNPSTCAAPCMVYKPL